MKENGFNHVYQIDGGIAKYGEAFGDSGLWEGSLYVFDDRMTTKFSGKAKDIGACVFCGANTSIYNDCSDSVCNKLFLACKNCGQDGFCPQCIKARETDLNKSIS
jgi:UPF0176 protein